MLIDGIKIIESTSNFGLTIFGNLYIIIVILLIAVCFFAFISFIVFLCMMVFLKYPNITKDIAFGHFLIGIISIVIVLGMIFYFDNCNQAEVGFRYDIGKNEYKCEVIDKIDFDELYLNYEILSYEDNILTLLEK